MIPFGAGGSVVGGRGSKSRLPDPAAASCSEKLGESEDVGPKGRLGGRRPSDSNEASAALRPAA
jgi:hypothetical protein